MLSPSLSPIVDFYCAEKRLVVEVEGPVHYNQIDADQQRTQVLEEQGNRVIRLPKEQVQNDLESALQTILAACSED